MYRKDFVRSVAELLRTSGERKIVQLPKQVLHVSDDDGNSRDFFVKRSERKTMYTADDVNKIIDACIEVIERALKSGDEVAINGFGTFGLKYRKARRTKDMSSGEPIEIAARFVPKFVPGTDVKMCAKIYSMGALGDDRLSDDLDIDDDIPEWAMNDGT